MTLISFPLGRIFLLTDGDVSNAKDVINLIE